MVEGPYSELRSHLRLMDAFDFDLPDDRIALRPVSPRDAARLLVVRSDGALEDRHVSDLPALLRTGDVVVVNDTRVIPAALRARRPPRTEGESGAEIRINLHQRTGLAHWRAFVRPAKRLRAGDRLEFGADGRLDAAVEQVGEGGEVLLRFGVDGRALDAALEAFGETPLPPYIRARRSADAQDRADYQTVFACRPGSVAAPTAGLHFTPELFERLALSGVTTERVTLHVGAGTFLPVKSDRLDDHRMHAEWCEVGASTAEAIRSTRGNGGRCVAVGTTSLRTLEAASQTGGLRAWSGLTDIFISPGHRFQTVDALLTNFHLPRSTLFILVCALMGVDVMRRAYTHAIEAGYRFYSYGDACLLLPGGGGRGGL